MKARALVVPRREGEAVRRALAESGRLRTDLKIREEGDRLLLPLRDGASVPEGWGDERAAEFDPRPEEAPADYRELLPWPEADRALLPRSFDVVGDIVLVRFPFELRERRAEVGDALRRFVPGSRLVGWDHGVRGAERRREVEPLAGGGGWSTVHRENHLELDVDLERAYFSPRLAHEHARVAAEVGAGERVYDLCCGVGPFSVHIARDGRATEIVAVDANPDAIELLRRTLARYRFGGRVTPVGASLESFLPRRPPFERAILNLPHEGIKYAPSVARVVAPGGRLHLYEIVPRSEVEHRGDVIASLLEPAGHWSTLGTRIVHPYSPESDLAVFDLARRPD